jgi:HD-GYP domain-containing protein (c-di-GMP phosphodiesterase class II)
MLRVELAAAKPGMQLALPVSHPRHPTRILLRAGYDLDAGAIKRMLELRIRSIWVSYPSLVVIEKFIDPRVLAAQARVVEQITQTFERVQQRSNAKLPYAAYCRSVGQLINDLVGNPKAALFIDELVGSSCNDLMRHSSTVTYLSVLMGLKLEGYLVRQRKQLDPVRAMEVTNLGIGAMLHDVGITRMDRQAVECHMASGDESDPVWRRHPWVGYEMVKGSVEPTAANVVMHHHQRFDGSGYGGKDGEPLEGTRIHVFARIVGLAEQFDRLRNPPGMPTQPTVWALGALLGKTMVNKFDPEVMRALFSVVPAFPPGSMVKLSNGRSAVVIDHHSFDPCHPIVQLFENEQAHRGADGELSQPIDLSISNAGLMIVECDGRDVSDLNFAPPRFLLDNLEWAMRA